MNGDLDKVRFPHGICPFMSGQLAPVAAPGGLVRQGQIAVSSINLPCLGEKCQLWCFEGCCFKRLCGLAAQIDNVAFRLSDIVDGLGHLEPPKDGPGPLMRIADALEQILKRKDVPK